MARVFLQIDPRKLRLPHSRSTGADPGKLQRQIAKFGKTTAGMPPPWVSQDQNGELKILDGVTRATRVTMLLPGQTIEVEITDEEHNADYRKLPLLGDIVP